MIKYLILLAFISTSVFGATATWNAVTTDSTGAAITVGGYEIGIGTSSCCYTTINDVGDVTTATITLPNQTAYVAVRAYPQATDTAHTISPWGNQVVVPVGGSTSSTQFGETTILSGQDSGNADLLIAQSATLPNAGILQSLSFYVTSAAGKLRLGIYDSGGANGGPGMLIASTDEITPVADSWNTAPVTSQVNIPAGTYWLAYLASDNGLGFVKADGTVPSWYRSFCYGFMPAHFSDTSACASTPLSNTPSVWSFYATVAQALAAPTGLTVTP